MLDVLSKLTTMVQQTHATPKSKIVQHFHGAYAADGGTIGITVQKGATANGGTLNIHFTPSDSTSHSRQLGTFTVCNKHRSFPMQYGLANLLFLVIFYSDKEDLTATDTKRRLYCSTSESTHTDSISDDESSYNTADSWPTSSKRCKQKSGTFIVRREMDSKRHSVHFLTR